MAEIQPAYGLWNSPISPRSLAGALRLSDLQWDSDGATLVWLEGRSDRGVLVSAPRDGDAPRDLTETLSVRARVGYGGGDFGVGGGYAFFSAGGKLYRQPLATGGPKSIVPAFGDAASPVVSPDGRWSLYVFSYERRDGLALADAEGKQWPQQVASGHDFYMQPRWSPKGTHVAWVAWDHPNMPWDGCSVYIAEVDSSNPGTPRLTNVQAIAGGESVSAMQPEFSPDGNALAYLSDAEGWYNLYLYQLESATTHRLTREQEAELAGPAWGQGQRTYGWAHDAGALYYVRNERGFDSLWRYDLSLGESEPVMGLEGYTHLSQPALNPLRAQLAVIASAGTQPTQVVLLDLDERARLRVLRRTSGENVPPQQLVAPQPVSWRGSDGAEVHGLLYRPAGSAAGLPPAIVRVHGGPTDQRTAAYDAQVQFLVTRGYALLDVNYRGSTGYGRAYTQALRGNWGVYDVADAVSGAHYLAQSNLADARRMVIMGGSAGGFTVLQTLITNPGVFKAGVCLYGVSNMFTLASDTHKFEERYLDSLLGPLPEAAAIYRERSPIFQADQLRDPLAVFQGTEDQVVPRAQSDEIVESLRRRNVPHVYHLFEGEGHGWRKAETIEAFYAAVEAFLKQYVLFS